MSYFNGYGSRPSGYSGYDPYSQLQQHMNQLAQQGSQQHLANVFGAGSLSAAFRGPRPAMRPATIYRIPDGPFIGFRAWTFIWSDDEPARVEKATRMWHTDKVIPARRADVTLHPLTDYGDKETWANGPVAHARGGVHWWSNAGLYAYKEPDQRREFDLGSLVVGRLRLHGTVVEHEWGYRAEHATIDLLVTTPSKKSVREALERKYACSVVEVLDPDEMVDALLDGVRQYGSDRGTEEGAQGRAGGGAGEGARTPESA